ncbi:MAG: flavin-containing monooxygenase [Pseudomonadales bacterium]
MTDYLAILETPAPVNVAEVKRLARHGCLDIHRVRWPLACLADDGRRMLCWYQARDAESVRLVLRQQGYLEAAVLPVGAAEGGMVPTGDCVIAEWEAAAGDPVVGQRVAHALAAAGFGSAHGLVRPGGAAGVCVVGGGEVEPVADCIELAGVTVTRVWRATAVDPRPAPLFAASAAARADEAPAKRQTAPSTRPAPAPAGEVLDAIIIGAGMSGLCMLERLRRMGLTARVYERGADVGGVWYWNRYPGARVDSEVYTYGYAFSEALLRDWSWQELFSAQPELSRYFRHVADRFELRPHVRFNTRVDAAIWDPAGGCWRVETDTGERVAARFLIAASGSLTEPQLPDYPGIDTFAGELFHTARWPESGVDLAGKRVGVIGTGATGVQVIQTIAPAVASLTVFQRTPNYCLPQRNRPLADADRARIAAGWADILAACRKSAGGFIHVADARSGLAVTAAEREAKFEALWAQPGFAFWFSNFADLMMSAEFNELACDFVRRKIRARVTDPAVAARLMPDHPFGSKRVPLENGYYETFNRPNVRLVDLRDTPIEQIAPTGIRTAAELHTLDVIVCATGFDAGTGALTRIDLRGADGGTLTGKWRDGPRTFLGLLVAGFPNLFIVNGPHNAAALCNAGRCIEQNVDWIARCLDEMRARCSTRIEPTPEAEAEWTEHVHDVAAGSVLARMTNSWFYGANTPGKPRKVTIYAAGARAHREQCEAVAAAGYPGLTMG